MVSPEAIAAAWATWHSRHGGKLGPGPAFAEAIAAAVAVESGAIQRAGLIAGLREAAEWHEAEAEKVQPSWPALASIEVSDAEALAIRRDISGHNRWSAMVFRARITALEEEKGS